MRCWRTWNSLHLQLKHNSTVSEARFVLHNSGFFKIDFGPALILLPLHVADRNGCNGEGCTCSLLPPWVGWSLHRVGRGRTSLPRWLLACSHFTSPLVSSASLLSTWSCCCPPLPKPTLMSTTFLRIKPSPRLLDSYSEAQFDAKKVFFYVKAYIWFFADNFPFQNKDTVKLSSLPHPRKLLQILQILLLLEGFLRAFCLHGI